MESTLGNWFLRVDFYCNISVLKFVAIEKTGM